MDHRAVGANIFEPEHEIAHRAVADDIDAAGIGRDHPADLAGALAAEAEREKPVLRRGRLLDIGEDAAGLGCERVTLGVDSPDLV